MTPNTTGWAYLSQMDTQYEMNPRYIKALDSFPFLKEISDTTYPFSNEDAAFDSMSRTEESFTLYSVDLSG